MLDDLGWQKSLAEVRNASELGALTPASGEFVDGGRDLLRRPEIALPADAPTRSAWSALV
jgi:hypothetical protein